MENIYGKILKESLNTKEFTSDNISSGIKKINDYISKANTLFKRRISNDGLAFTHPDKDFVTDLVDLRFATTITVNNYDDVLKLKDRIDNSFAEIANWHGSSGGSQDTASIPEWAYMAIPVIYNTDIPYTTLSSGDDSTEYKIGNLMVSIYQVVTKLTSIGGV